MNFLFGRLIKNSLIFLSLSLSHSLISPVFFFLLNISPVTLSSLSLKQTSLPPLISSRHLTPHAADRRRMLAHQVAGLKLIEGRQRCVTDRLISRRRSFAHQAATPPIVCSLSRRSETHGARRRATCL